MAHCPMTSHPLDDRALRDSDLVLILTDHQNIDYARVVKLAALVFDTRNATGSVVAPNVKRLGDGR